MVLVGGRFLSQDLYFLKSNKSILSDQSSFDSLSFVFS